MEMNFLCKVQELTHIVKFSQEYNGLKDTERFSPKAKQNITEFKAPQKKRETQKFVGLLGFWRQYILHLGQILNPLYKVTRKKHEFQWAVQEQ